MTVMTKAKLATLCVNDRLEIEAFAQAVAQAAACTEARATYAERLRLVDELAAVLRQRRPQAGEGEAG